MINRSVLVGRLTKDPELKYTPSGVAACSFILAVNRPFANAQGEREADFIPVQVWRKQAENAANYLRKGSLAGVEGRIQVRHYEGQDGKRVYMTEVIADSVQFLEPKSAQQDRQQPGAGSEYQNYGPPQNSQQRPQNQNNGRPQNGSQWQGNQQRPDSDPFAGSGPIEVSDDDLPF